MTPDLVNAAFELGGAVLLWLDVARLRRDRMLRGVYWPVRAFFWAWGVWNIYYYPAIGQTLSFAAGLAVVLANTGPCLLLGLGRLEYLLLPGDRTDVVFRRRACRRAGEHRLVSAGVPLQEELMRVLGVDTASEPSSRGYAIAEDGRIIWSGKRPPGALLARPDFVAGERPWAGQKLRGQALITFCVNNGFQLRDAWPASAGEPPPFILIPVRDWKNLALPGCAGMPGDVFCANFRQRYAPHVTDTDILDAMGIALAVSKLTAKQLKKFVPKGFTRP